jgi:GYF domain 2
MKKYYLHDGKEKQGPFSLDELRAKAISKIDEIWFEDLRDWTPAGRIDELKELFKATPPPIKPKKGQSTEHGKKTASKKIAKNLFLLVIIIGGLSTFAGLIISHWDSFDFSTSDSYADQKLSMEEIESASPLKFLSADGEYKSSFWGTELKIRGNIINNASVATYKDVQIKVTYYSKTKSVISSNNYTVYEIFKPSSSTPFKLDVPNIDNVESIGWKVIGATPIY